MVEPDSPATKGKSRPNTQDRQAWQAFWAKQGQTWRTEPEIDAERQAELAARRSLTPDVAQGLYPFKGIKLTRADLEWLLATHEQGRGPVDYQDPSQRERVGLDLRGADLSYAQLQNLPLARTLGDVTWRCWPTLTEKQHRMAAVQLQQADLKGAHLEGSSLEYANLEGADLRGGHLEEANLGSANLQIASLYFLFAVLYAPPHLDWPEALIASITAFHGRVFSSAFLPGSPQSTAAAFEAVTGLIFEGVFIAMLTQRFFGR